MPIFHYKGFRSDGSEATGMIEASGLNDAIARVRAEGIFPSDIAEPRPVGKRKLFQRTDETFLPNVTRQLATLLSSGVPLIDAFMSLAAEYRGFYREMLIAIKERVSGGAGLSRALKDFGDVFPEFYRNMVRSGEESGNLDTVLRKLADYLERQSAVRAKVRSSMVYPIFMMGVSIVVLSFLFTFVIPKIVKIFRDAKSTLPFVTVLLIGISNLFVGYWWALIGGATAVVLYAKKFLRENRLSVDRLILRLPGNIIQSLYYSRFARTMGFLLDGGLPMLKALGLSARSMGNRELEASVLSGAAKVAEGQRLSASLEKFPPVFVQLVATGEKSGKLPESLNRAADSYEEEFNRRINQALSLFEPIMIVVMGLVVGFIALAVLLPMFQLNQLIK
ncbi:MAG TPA: type II secretion system F family protein [Thermodesulfovibrionales bacterium]|nr:type II secretion system F family protein [Thermodesulfovibrionales bacterium]